MLVTIFHYILSLRPGGTWNPPGQSVLPVIALDCSDIIHIPLPENTTILGASYITAGSHIKDIPVCDLNVMTTVNACNVSVKVDTSPNSSVRFEIWLPEPDAWNNGVLTAGNGGFGGCIDYSALDYGTSLNFATIASNDGNDRQDGSSFLNQPEVINDVAYRAIHVATVTGKEIVEKYYSRKPKWSYYSGCSTGGRQGIQAALLYPEDFDGIIAGAPAVDFNHLLGSVGLLTNSFRPPCDFSQPLWQLVFNEVMNQCDLLDGQKDGIITEPDDCHFDPEPLLCRLGEQPPNCLNPAQVCVLHKFYSTRRGMDKQELYPRFDPGSEVSGFLRSTFTNGVFSFLADQWYKYGIYNNASYTFNDFDISDIAHADITDPGRIMATWSGNLSEFRRRGGKLMTFHGRADGAIPSGISKWLHKLISSTMSSPNIDDFYRLFLVPGMDHCAGGPGAWHFGQGASKFNINDTDHNILLALVHWVENGIAPLAITGVDEEKHERKHCLYPQKSVWNEKSNEWECTPPECGL